MGTPDFALPSLQSLIEDERFEVITVITQEDKKVGRQQQLTRTPVKMLAEKYDIPVLQPEKVKKNTQFIECIQNLKADFIVVVSYGQILPNKIIQAAKISCVNVHTSLLPKYRGASPIQSALLNGDKESGVSIMRVEEKMDQGGIYYLKKISIDNDDNAESLRVKLSLLAGSILPETLIEIAEQGLQPIPQDESRASYCKKISKDDGALNFEEETAEELFNKVKAYNPWPSTFCLMNGKRLKIVSAKFNSTKNAEPGSFVHIDKNIIGIGTKKGLLIPLEVQLEGKKVMPIHEFLRGNKDLLTKPLTSAINK